MANNCWNYVAITGDKRVVDTLQKHFENYENTKYFTEFADAFFNKKRDYKEQPFDFYYEYGTKWWDFEWDRHSETELVIQGDSAWSPPLELLKRISKKYSCKVYAEYQEYGNDFAGRVTYKHGKTKEKWECSAQRMDLEHMGAEEFYDYHYQWGHENLEEFINSISEDVIEYIGVDGVAQFTKWFKEDEKRSKLQAENI